jgi:hypothetical protein
MEDNISDIDKVKIHEALEAIRKQYGDQRSELSDLINEDGAKLIDCRHEIVISVLATVMEQDDEGNFVGTKTVAKKNYHIPVPSNINHEDYLDGFFNFLENCMSTSAVNTEEKIAKEENTNG